MMSFCSWQSGNTDEIMEGREKHMSKNRPTPRRTRRMCSLLVSLALGVSLLPAPALAADSGGDADRTVFDALGFDTKAPEGYQQDEGLSGTPYGKTYTTMAEVDELFTFEPKRNSGAKSDALYSGLYGHERDLLEDAVDTLGSPSSAAVNLNGRGSYNGPISLQVEGNFSRDNRGQKKNTAFININFVSVSADDTEVWNKVQQNKGALVNLDLGVMDPVSGSLDVFYRATQNAAKFDSDMGNLHPENAGDAVPLYLGNPGDAVQKTYSDRSTTGEYLWEFKSAYMAQNYIELAAGDFDGDSVDEIAVYLGETGNPRVEVWKLQDQTGDGYLNPGHYEKNIMDMYVDTGTRTWRVAWSYPLNQYGTSIVPNMVSLAAADYDKDGIDDLAVSWGYFGGGTIQPSHAVIMMGADNNRMLTRSYTFPLTANGTDVYRASFTAGDVDNDGYNELVMGGSLANSTLNSRYLAIYEWQGDGFAVSAQENFNLFEEENGVRKWQNIKDEKTYYSMPYAPANIAVGKLYGVSEAPCIYLDSIVIQYGSDGFDILDLLTRQVYPQEGTAQAALCPYVEWGARTADLTGSGQDLLFTMANVTKTTSYRNIYELLQVTFSEAYQNLYSLRGVRLSRSSDAYSAETVYTRTAEYNADGSNVRNFASLSFCLPNTDSDTTILRYTGEHSYTYADPEVLAVLASPPYFADLANGDDDSQMIESSTSYSSTRGSGSGTSYSNSFSVGVYTSWEKSFKIFGVELFSAEAEASINNTFTWETQKTSSLEYEVTYSTMAGLDTVVLYSMPIETYAYEAQVPDGSGGYDTQTMTVNIPYEPSVQTLPLAAYQEIQREYGGLLPDVSPALTHTIGDPGSYASSVGSLPAGRTQTLVYQGNPFTIGQGSQNTQEQSIAMTHEEENSFNYEFAVETKAGVGAGGVTVGITAGYSHGAGKVHISTAGSSYTGTMNGLPTQAEQYGYSFNWRLVGFLYQDRYPVVTYLVTGVKEPPLLPENFGADEDGTTTDRITLEWDYPGNAAGFVLYRYFQSPSASGFYKLGTVQGGDFTVENDVKHYRYTDKGLSPNTGYQYRIQTIGMSLPNTSIPSEAYSTYTKPETGVPQVAVSETRLNAYPDTVVWTSANVTNRADLPDGAKLYYQWQKRTVRGGWEDAGGETGQSLTFRYPSAGVEGVYRCKVSALADQNLVTTYSPEVTVTFQRRAAEITSVTVSGDTVTAVVRGADVTTIPAGTVRFTLKSAGAESVYTAKLDARGTASVQVSPADGVYKVTASYGGSKVFLPAAYDPETPVFLVRGVAGGTYVDVQDSYTYGDTFDFVRYTVDGTGAITGQAAFQPDAAAYQVQIRRSWKAAGANAFYLFGDGSDADASKTVQARFAAGYAGWVGSYRLTDGGNTYAFTVKPRAAAFTGLRDQTFTMDTVNGIASGANPSYLSSLLTFENCAGWESDRTIQRLQNGTSNDGGWLRLEIFDTAGKAVELPIQHPGVYALRYENGLQSGTVVDNYDLTLPAATLIVTGSTYPVSAAVAAGQDTYGSVSVASPAGASAAPVGQTLILRAVPNAGYEVAGWTLNGAAVSGSAGQETLTVTQTAAGTAAEVSFRTKENRLTVTTLTETPTVNGAPVTNTVTADDSYFQSGNSYSTGYEVTFTPVAAEGWHFTGWEYHTGGQSPQYSSEPAFTVRMPDGSVQLYAKFERDTYALTLGEHLNAFVGGKPVEIPAAIPGDSIVTVMPAAGYHLESADGWTLTGGTALDQSETALTFVLLQNAGVTAQVTAGTYTVELDAENLTGGTAEATQTGEVSGGTQLTFTAAADRGYAFDGWYAGSSRVSGDACYTFTVSEDVTLTPVFRQETGRSLTFGAGENGSLSWTIPGVDGDEYPGSEVTLYPGETVTFTAVPRGGYMVAGWSRNGRFTQGTHKTAAYAYEDVEDGTDISVTFKPVTYFTVSFTADVTAEADGADISSGTSVAAGSRVVFTYPGTDRYVSQWRNGEELLQGPAPQLVVEDLTGALDISITTESATVYTISDDSASSNGYQAEISGYALNGGYVAECPISIVVTPMDGFRVAETASSEVDFVRDRDGSWSWTADSWNDGDISFTVRTAPLTAVTFDAAGGTLSGGTTAVADQTGRLPELPVPSREGYSFAGWFTEAENGEKVTEDTVFDADAVTLYAHWTQDITPPASQTYTITFDAEGGVLPGAATAETDENGRLAALPTPAREGYTFQGWYTAQEGGVQADVSTVFTADATLYARWTQNSTGGGSSGGGGGGGAAAPVTVSQITLTKPEHGTLTSSAKRAEAGDLVTVTAAPDSGYQLSRLHVTDQNGRDLTVQELGGGRYTFRMPAGPITVTAEFAPLTAETPVLFTDVPVDAYYAEAVAWAVRQGITSGKTAAVFAPNAPCTRAQIVTFLWRAAGSPEPKTSNPFGDVAADAYYAKAVVWAVENGVTTGIRADSFAPDIPCTRAQAVAFLYRYAAAQGMDAVTLQELVSGFQDAAEVPAYAIPAMNWALASGIMQGSGGRLLPSSPCTRAQIVTFLYRQHTGK